MEKSNLPAELMKPLGILVNGLKDIYGDGLVSVMLYGSSASGEHTGKHSNMNVAIIMNDTSLPNLAKASKLLSRRELKPVNPVFFTEEYIGRSTDTFPIEFLDMKENHLLLYGKDVVRELNVDLKNLRFQCEQELKSKIINLKGAYLFHKNSPEMKKLLFRVFTSSLHVLRNLLRLKGHVVPYAKEAVIKALAESFGIDASTFSKILDAKNRNLSINNKEVEKLLFDFAGDLEKITAMIDKL